MSAKKDYERAKKEHDEWEERLSAALAERNLLEEKLAIADQEFTSMEVFCVVLILWMKNEIFEKKTSISSTVSVFIK